MGAGAFLPPSSSPGISNSVVPVRWDPCPECEAIPMEVSNLLDKLTAGTETHRMTTAPIEIGMHYWLQLASSIRFITPN